MLFGKNDIHGGALAPAHLATDTELQEYKQNSISEFEFYIIDN